MPRSRASSTLLALGAVSSAILAVAALLDVGDPLAEARARIEQSADAQEALVHSAFDAVQRRSEPPGPPGPLDVVVASDPRPIAERTPAASKAATDPIVELLLDASLAAARAGDLATALSRVEEALDREPEAPTAALARLHAARCWSAIGSGREVARHRSALDAIADAQVDGTSAKLLACLVEPVDAERAFARLSADRGLLAQPRDAWRTVDGGLVYAPDPWHTALRARLQSHAPELDWDLAFDGAARRARAAIPLLEGAPEPREDAWSFHGLGETDLALATCAVDGGVRAVAIDRKDLAAEILSATADAPPLVRDPLIGDEQPRETRTLTVGPDLQLPFSVFRPDPAVVARPEIRRLRLVRGALFGLAALVLLGAVVGARAMERARRLAELRSTFVASVSHDLRTPTQAILLMAETLEQERVATDASRARYHTQIRREAQRLRRLVEDLLDGARVDRGDGARIARQTVDVAAFFDDLESAMTERAEAAGADLRMTRGALPETIEVDPDGVRRAAWNLFENALTHGKVGERPARVTVDVSMRDMTLQVDVADDGPGVPARFRESIFEPFERLADRRRREGLTDDTGTGLGLAIVRALSRAHGGNATLAPSERGAHFVATFPVQEGAA
ncbi:MAG: HAMP domain-containing sensor histidine kinase [Planctomycetota bacterium]